MSPRDIPEGDLPTAAPPIAPPPGEARPKPHIALLIAATGLGPFTMQRASPVSDYRESENRIR